MLDLHTERNFLVSMHYPLPLSDLFETIEKKFLKSNFSTEKATKKLAKTRFRVPFHFNFHILETFLQ